MSRSALPPILLEHEFPHLKRVGMEMLRDLTAEDWFLPTAVPGWNVHDDKEAWQDLLTLLSTIAGRRRSWYASFVERWSELESEGFADELIALTRSRRS